VQQQALVTLVGALQGNVKSVPLEWTFGSGPGQTVPYMQGVAAPAGQAIQTFYGSVVLTDELVQASLLSVIIDPANPWNSLAMFRIATASLILVDATGSTQ
jgi:hypothetical protein